MTSNLPFWRPYMGVKGVLAPIFIPQIDIFQSKEKKTRKLKILI